jgi:Arc/MetJ-type ribon-helix-helix transcriptional regulator
MGKRKISVTVDEDMLGSVERMLESGRFRNRSHVMEFGLRKLMEVGDE